ncbi:MAG TPA: SDR family NAD(P)-dependent oxidoreductase [Acidimicrobiales bacterium]|nr:SDR family NAD(P)-dependent oxidoreductase [Acidimicrobiales bacterium]
MDAQGIAVVTGASRGFGRAIAIELARAGFDVVATMRDPQAGAGLREAVRGGSGTITVTRLDVTEPDSIELPDGLRVLVNNAGTEADYLPVEAVPMAQWRHVFETNLFGLVEVTRRAVPLMRTAGGGVICNITSASLAMSVPFYSVYRASKAAVQTMGESLRAEVAPFGIRVVEIMPGPVDTDMLAASARPPEAAECPGYETMAQSMHEGRTAVDEFITPSAIAATAVLGAILADDGPLRWSCDRLGRQLLSGWQADPDGILSAR